MTALPPEFLDPRTPADVAVTDRVRQRHPDPTLGVAVPDPGPAGPPAGHGLVTIGDSLTHGMTSGAVSDPEWSWPAVAARCLGTDMVLPQPYGGPLHGLPFNIEGLLRELQREFGTRLGGPELLRLPFVLHGLVDANEDHWERGPGRTVVADVRTTNLAVYGWDVRDCLAHTVAVAQARLAGPPPPDELLGAVPAGHAEIALRSVLGGYGGAAAQIDAADRLGREGGIGTLVVALGANNALGSVVHKHVAWSGPGYDTLDGKARYTVWRPTHFALEYGELVRRVRDVAARRVVLATVPHVTVAPVAQGVNPDSPGRKWRDGSRYFPYYTDPWISEGRFDPRRHRHLTHQQARAVDSAVDQYNDTIAGAVRQARSEGRDWLLLDLCGILDGLAQRRFRDDDEAARLNGWEPYPLPAELAGLDTRFFRSDATGRLAGGLFGLDGVHPTVSGYAVLAGALLDVLAAAGVDPSPVDYAGLRRRDPLDADPPALMTAAFDLVAPFLTRLVSRR